MGISLISKKDIYFRPDFNLMRSIGVGGSPSSIAGLSWWGRSDQCSTGGSRDFNGTNDNFTRASNAAYNFGIGDILLSLYFYFDSAGGRLVQKYQDSTNYWRLELDLSNKLHFIAVVGGVTKIEVQGTTVITTTGQWYHVALVVDRDSIANTKIYLDGVDDTSGTPTVSVDNIDNTGAISMGSIS
jgi:hypothetical protein